MSYLIGVDIGGTNIKSGLVSGNRIIKEYVTTRIDIYQKSNSNEPNFSKFLFKHIDFYYENVSFTMFYDLMVQIADYQLFYPSCFEDGKKIIERISKKLLQEDSKNAKPYIILIDVIKVFYNII